MLACLVSPPVPAVAPCKYPTQQKGRRRYESWTDVARKGEKQRDGDAAQRKRRDPGKGKHVAKEIVGRSDSTSRGNVIPQNAACKKSSVRESWRNTRMAERVKKEA